MPPGARTGDPSAGPPFAEMFTAQLGCAVDLAEVRHRAPAAAPGGQIEPAPVNHARRPVEQGMTRHPTTNPAPGAVHDAMACCINALRRDPVVALVRLSILEQPNYPQALLDMERPPTGSIEGRTLRLALDDEKKDRSGGDQSDGSDRGHYGACLGGSELVGRLRLGRAGHPMYPPSLVVLLRPIYRMSTDTCYLVTAIVYRVCTARKTQAIMAEAIRACEQVILDGASSSAVEVSGRCSMATTLGLTMAYPSDGPPSCTSISITVGASPS
jgi:hypothetical protein